MNFSYAHYQAAAAFLRVHPFLSLSAGGQYMHFVFAYYHHQDRIVVIDRHQSASGIIFKSRVVKLAKLRLLVVPYGLGCMENHAKLYKFDMLCTFRS